MKRKLRSIWSGFWLLLDYLSKKFDKDHIAAYSAQATFYLMLSVAPFVMMVCLVSRLLPFNEQMLLRLVRLLIPEGYQEIGISLVDGYYNENINSFWAKLVMIVFLIWSVSRLIQALINGFNMTYCITETRSQTIIRLIGCVYSVALCLLIVILIGLYAVGTRVTDYIVSLFPKIALLDLIMTVTRNLAAPLLMLLIFWLSYIMLPSRRTRRLRDELPGALMTAVVWRVVAGLYSTALYGSVERYSYVYGSLAGVVMILLWLYFCVYCWFLGGELNWFLAERREGRLPETLWLFRVRKDINKQGKKKKGKK